MLFIYFSNYTSVVSTFLNLTEIRILTNKYSQQCPLHIHDFDVDVLI